MLVLILGYASYYLYIFDKTKGGINEVTTESRIKIQEHLTEEFWKNITPEQLKDKLKDIVDVNEVNSKYKKSMLHLLVFHGQFPEMVSFLVDAGVDYNLRDSQQTVALHWAVIREKQAYQFSKEILKYNVDVNASDQINASVLYWAAHNRSSFELIKLLLERGADPNIQTTDQWTALMAASVPNHYNKVSFVDSDVIKLLLDYKADITVRNKDGKTALDYMKENKEFNTTDLFKRLYNQNN